MHDDTRVKEQKRDKVGERGGEYNDKYGFERVSSQNGTCIKDTERSIGSNDAFSAKWCRPIQSFLSNGDQ